MRRRAPLCQRVDRSKDLVVECDRRIRPDIVRSGSMQLPQSKLGGGVPFHCAVLLLGRRLGGRSGKMIKMIGESRHVNPQENT